MTDLLKPVTSISLSGLGKKYNNNWIFRDITFDINSGDRVAITGRNGSGKSTLLQMLSGYITPSEGKISWNASSVKLPDDQIFRHVAFASPYMDLIDDFTLLENVNFFIRHKPLINNIRAGELIELSGLTAASGKQLRFFSSGMKQRVKLALAMKADTGVLLLDEPLSNLDDDGYNWYRGMISQLDASRIVMVCSNRIQEETFFCNRFLEIEHYKK